MSYHISGGSGAGWFKLAGSVYNSTREKSYPNKMIKLYTESDGNGNLIKTIEVDGNGNFHTTEDIDFTNELFTSVTSLYGNVNNMNSSISTGMCNSCHGNSTNNIWVE